MEERGWFGPPVSMVDPRRVHITLQVTNVVQVARLLHDWRGERGPAYRAAAEACIAWYEKRGDEDAVRDAFEAAVAEREGHHG